MGNSTHERGYGSPYAVSTPATLAARLDVHHLERGRGLARQVGGQSLEERRFERAEQVALPEVAPVDEAHLAAGSRAREGPNGGAALGFGQVLDEELGQERVALAFAHKVAQGLEVAAGEAHVLEVAGVALERAKI